MAPSNYTQSARIALAPVCTPAHAMGLARAFTAPFSSARTASALAASALLCSATPLWAQSSSAENKTLEAITVTSKAGVVFDVDTASVGGFSAPIADTPQSITVLGSDLISATGMQTLSQALRLDASLSDSYNTPGYMENVSVRGFTLEHVGNYQRNGLVVNNFAPLAFENKESIEILKGVAGLQTGVSAPGGLVNYVTKKPQPYDFTAVSLHGDQRGSSKIHVDANHNIGSLGVRLNAAAENLHSHYHDANGSRRFFSVAAALPVTTDTRLTGDFEYQYKSQPSVPGLGMLDMDGDGVGEALPSRINPRLNLNNQPWSLPYQTHSAIAQLGLEHTINADWQTKLGLSHTRTRINDRIAFPDGCGQDVYPGLCSNGDVTLYDYRKDGVKDNLTSWQAELDGRFDVASINNKVKFGLDGYHARHRDPAFSAYNDVGLTNIYQPQVLPPNATASDLGTYRNEKSLAGFVSLNTQWSERWQSFAGWRITRLDRNSERSDGSRGVSQKQTVNTPWLGLTFKPRNDVMLYASWGKGVELAVAENRANRVANPGQVLPALKSTQKEVGVKWQANDRLLLSAAAFDIKRPETDSIVFDGMKLPTVVAGAKEAHHRGVELNAAGRVSRQLNVQASATWLDARYSKAVNPVVQDSRVPNQARWTTSVFADYKIAAVQGLSVNGLAWMQEGKRATPSGDVVLPRGWQFDLGARYEHLVGNTLVQWTLNVENVTNHIYWREAAYTSWGGVYLFPSAPRTVRASVRVEF